MTMTRLAPILKAIFFISILSNNAFALGNPAFKKWKCKTLDPEKEILLEVKPYKTETPYLLKGTIKKREKGQLKSYFSDRDDIALFLFFSWQTCEVHVIDSNPLNFLFHLRLTLGNKFSKNPVTMEKSRAHWSFLIDDTYLNRRFDKLLECNIDSLRVPENFLKICKQRETKAPKVEVIINDNHYVPPQNSGNDQSGGGSRGR